MNMGSYINNSIAGSIFDQLTHLALTLLILSPSFPSLPPSYDVSKKDTVAGRVKTRNCQDGLLLFSAKC